MGFKTLTKKLNEAKFVNSARGETDESDSISQSLTDAQEKAELLNEARKIKRGKASLGAAGAASSGAVGNAAGANSNLSQSAGAVETSANFELEDDDEILTRKITGIGRKGGKNGANAASGGGADVAGAASVAGDGANVVGGGSADKANPNSAQNVAQNFVAQSGANSNLSAAGQSLSQNFPAHNPNSNLGAAGLGVAGQNFAQNFAAQNFTQPHEIETLAEPTAKKRGLKRNKTILLYFSPEELESIKAQAENMYMNVNQYIRFKLFFGN